MSEGPRVSVERLTKRMRGTVVLDGVSMRAEPGSVTALVGPNGSGKTMLLRCIAGLVLPESGVIRVGDDVVGHDVASPRDMGLLIERPALLPRFTGLENLKMLASVRGVVGEDELRATLELVGLDSADRRRCSAYSLGMKQRLGIAAAIMERPALLMLDEPTNALDADGVKMVARAIEGARSEGATVLVTSHDDAFVRSVATAIWPLAEGHNDGPMRPSGSMPAEGRGKGGPS